MIDHNDTGATGRPWSYEIQHGPNGEEIYAWVYYLNFMVCTVKVHHAKMIVEAVNAHDRLTTENAELRRERDDFKERLAVADASLVLETGAGINTHETMLRVSKRWCARAHAAEDRIAVLEKELRPIVAVVSDYIERGLDEDDHVIAGRMTRRGDDKDTPPRITFGNLRKIADLAEQKGAVDG